MPILRSFHRAILRTLVVTFMCCVWSGSVYGIVKQWEYGGLVYKDMFGWVDYWEDCPVNCVCPGRSQLGKTQDVHEDEFCSRKRDNIYSGVPCTTKDDGFVECEVKGDDNGDRKTSFFRCPKTYPYSDKGSNKKEDCYLIIDTVGYKVTPAKSEKQECEPSEKPNCNYVGRVQYGQVIEPDKDYAGVISLETNDAEVDVTPRRLYVRKPETSDAYVVYVDNTSLVSSKQNPNNINSSNAVKIQNASSDKELIGFYDVNGKKMLKTTEKDGVLWGVFVGTNSNGFDALFLDGGNTTTWRAQYARRYTVKFNLNGGDGGPTGFSIFNGEMYVDDGTSNLFVLPIKDLPSKDNYVFDGYYYGDTKMIDSSGIKGEDFDYTVENISRNQTWTAHWKKIYKISLKNSASSIVDFLQVFDGNMYDTNVDVRFAQKKNREDIQVTDLPTQTDKVFAGYYYNGVEMISADGLPGEGFDEAIETMTADRTWSAQWFSTYKVTLNNECSSEDYGCITELKIGGGKVFPSKEIGKTEEEIQVGALDNIGVLPTRNGYVFEGYRYGPTLMINKEGYITNDAKEIIENIAVDQIWTAQWTECSTGAVEDNQCVMCNPGEYLTNTNGYFSLGDLNNRNTKTYTCAPCPQAENGSFGEDALYKFTLDKDYPLSLKSVDSCAIKLNTAKSACDANSNVILNYRASEDAYVRKDVFELYPSAKSMLKREADYPSAVQPVDAIDWTTDYCEVCKNDKFAIQVVEDGNTKTICSFCNNGNCVEKDTDGTQECVACPAGFYCPNEGRNLMCSDIKPAEINENLTYICKTGEYSGVGASNCSQCLDGYSTDGSGPAETGGNGLCIGTDSVGSGIGCTHVRACRQITPQLCTVEDCECTIEKIKKVYSNFNNEDTKQLIYKCHGAGNATVLLRSFKSIQIGGGVVVNKSAVEKAAEAAFKNKKLARCLCQSSFDLGDDVKISKTYRDFVKTIKRVSQSDENQSD